MNKQISRSINLLRFPLIVGVVFIHSSSTEVSLSAGKAVAGDPGYIFQYTQNLFSSVFGRISVPMFFLFSGYLLYGSEAFTLVTISNKWKKRFKTLFIPYLIWNIFVLVIQFVGQNAPVIQVFFSRNKWNTETMSIITFLDAFFGFDVGPINYPLWFIRDLMILIILSPLLYLLLTRSKGTFLALLFFLWFEIINVSFFVSNEALLFFSLGLFLARKKIDELPFRSMIFNLCVAYVLISLIEAHLKTIGISVFLIHKLNILLGCVAVFTLSTRVKENGRTESILILLSKVSFFIFLTHGSLLQVFKKVLFVLVRPQSDLVFVAIYFSAPLLTIILLIFIYFRVLPIFPNTLREVALGTR